MGRELSGGQQAQVVLSLALGTRPRILLLDEPLAHLDPLARRDFLALVTESVAQDGTTVVFSSHVMSDVAQACDWLIILADGRVLLDSPIAEAIRQHRRVPEAQPSQIVEDLDGPATSVARVVPVQPGHHEPGPSPTLDELVMSYLATARVAAETDRSPR
jgi:ABC-2 type transport system ATP-binding protein